MGLYYRTVVRSQPPHLKQYRCLVTIATDLHFLQNLLSELGPINNHDEGRVQSTMRVVHAKFPRVQEVREREGHSSQRRLCPGYVANDSFSSPHACNGETNELWIAIIIIESAEFCVYWVTLNWYAFGVDNELGLLFLWITQIGEGTGFMHDFLVTHRSIKIVRSEMECKFRNLVTDVHSIGLDVRDIV